MKKADLAWTDEEIRNLAVYSIAEALLMEAHGLEYLAKARGLLAPISTARLREIMAVMCWTRALEGKPTFLEIIRAETEDSVRTGGE